MESVATGDGDIQNAGEVLTGSLTVEMSWCFDLSMQPLRIAGVALSSFSSAHLVDRRGHVSHLLGPFFYCSRSHTARPKPFVSVDI